MPEVNVPVPDFPNKMTDFAHLGITMHASWQSNPSITLNYITVAVYGSKAAALVAKVGERIATGSLRPEQTDIMKELDELINDGEEAVKSYAIGKWGLSNYKGFLPQFGFRHRARHWELPRDHTQLLAALPLMIDAIATHGFGANEFGTAFWTQVQTDYQAAFGTANSIDGEVSEDVGEKNLLIAEVKKVLTSLYYVIVANYPDTWRNVLRDWGWQVEDF